MMVSEKARNPSDMMANARQAITFRYPWESARYQRTKAVSGDKTKATEGMPRISCIRRGKGKSPAPAMENEYERISHAGREHKFN